MLKEDNMGGGGAVSLGGLPEGGGLHPQDPVWYPAQGRCSGSTGMKEEMSTGW